tara:strand:+ start:176 stop:457 length:282 start_codon:yes stop_codon:yes gene_type:complete
MFISWKTDGSADAVATMESRLNDLDMNRAYSEWANANGRTNFKWDKVGGDLVITEEWSISREEYDAFVSGGQIDHTPGGISLPVVETTDHLTF